MTRIPLTVAGARKLREELNRLKKVERPRAIEALAEARGHGDVQENPDYANVKQQQEFIERRIRALEEKVANAQIIDPSRIDAGGRVVFGATVELYEPQTGKEVSYQIVGEDEADINEGLVSINSPLARALIGAEEGDEVAVQAPGGTRTYEIKRIRYE
ncbi:MAG: transcription elongation factor GreA [Gammaproteobacteria bacterium]|nr:transcription elongation factor GreA [Gammaproteobacteria bacterium]NIR83103.1 transcription elongation factor GreA [Gammaproteobacteria bacterium]NIR90765.1 transcription elongation factor GreA [Gammaproteobacteria bacterium]NIU04256.1 transcription elongation factor GreA [Gammaproteobacteria bacterium]NIV51548.1 transcription elongation factor GreA [Gammaproteobacteria bacterium]